MKLQSKKYFFLGVILSCFSIAGYSQELTPHKLSLEQAIEMGMQNHQLLKISHAQLEASEQKVSVSKSQQLPSVTFSANTFYLGDALILDNDWSKVQTVDMPHFGNTFSLILHHQKKEIGTLCNNLKNKNNGIKITESRFRLVNSTKEL